jgi:hypothetical protein
MGTFASVLIVIATVALYLFWPDATPEDVRWISWAVFAGIIVCSVVEPVERVVERMLDRRWPK